MAGDAAGPGVGLERLNLGLDRGIEVVQPVGPAEQLAQIKGLDGDAGTLEELLAVAHRLEGGGTGADGANSRAA